MVNQRSIILIAGVLAVVGLALLGWFLFTNSPDQDQPQVVTATETITPPSTSITEASESAAQPYLNNLDILMSVFSDQEYLFINDHVLNFAYGSLGLYNNLEIDKVSFGKRNTGDYGFIVRDTTNGNRLFYVNVERQANNSITVGEFLQ